MPCELTRNLKKKIIVWGVIFSCSTPTTHHFLIRLWPATKSGFYMTTGDAQLSGWTERKLQSQSSSEEGSLLGGLLPVWSTIAFWILAKSLPLRSMLSKLMRCTKNCNACSWYWSTKRAQFFPITSNCMLYNSSKSWTNWATKFCLLHRIHLTSHQTTTTSWSISTTFSREKHFHNQQEAENAFHDFIESWGMDFYATGIN